GAQVIIRLWNSTSQLRATLTASGHVHRPVSIPGDLRAGRRCAAPGDSLDLLRRSGADDDPIQAVGFRLAYPAAGPDRPATRASIQTRKRRTPAGAIWFYTRPVHRRSPARFERHFGNVQRTSGAV